MDAVFGVFLPRGGEDRLTRRAAGALRRASGGAALARLRPRRRGPRPSGGDGDRARGHAQGNGVAAETLKRHAGLGRGRTWPAAWLERQGYRVLARNWRCRSGEVDLVARRGSPRCSSRSRSGGTPPTAWAWKRSPGASGEGSSGPPGSTPRPRACRRPTSASTWSRWTAAQVRHEPNAFDSDGS